MKKYLVLILCSILVCVTFAFMFCEPVLRPDDILRVDSGDILRLHIRANSNAKIDQQTKYAVRNEVLSLITKVCKSCGSELEAEVAVEGIKSEIIAVASAVSGGEARVEITKEQFPTREYNGEILPSGEYNAVVISLGEGVGDNWWCVAFPPLCYIDGEEIEGDKIIFKSKIAEIWDKYNKDC